MPGQCESMRIKVLRHCLCPAPHTIHSSRSCPPPLRLLPAVNHLMSHSQPQSQPPHAALQAVFGVSPAGYRVAGVQAAAAWTVAAQNVYAGQMPGPCSRPFTGYYIPPWQPYLSYLPSVPAWWNVSKSMAAATDVYGAPPPGPGACLKSSEYRYNEGRNAIGANHGCENDCQCSGLRVCHKPNGVFGQCVNPTVRQSSLLTAPNVRGTMA